MGVFGTYLECVSKALVPFTEQNPDYLRLDGNESGGNREVFATFRHSGATWVIHADSHIEPLMIAAGAAVEGMDPFTRVVTKHGVRLDLRPELQRLKKNPGRRHLYIYQRSEATYG